MPGTSTRVQPGDGPKNAPLKCPDGEEHNFVREVRDSPTAKTPGWKQDRMVCSREVCGHVLYAWAAFRVFDGDDRVTS